MLPDCWGCPLWKVANAEQVLPPIHTWTSSGGMCVMSGAMGDAPLVANTVYLFGVTATGGAGMYSA